MKQLQFPGIEHIGYMVADLDEAVAAYRAWYGVADFDVYSYKPDEAYEYGERIDTFTLHIAKGHTAHGLAMEIICPGAEASPHRRYLEQYGPGMHHIAYKVEDYNGWKARLAGREALPILFEGVARDEVRGCRHSFYVRIPGIAELVEITRHTRHTRHTGHTRHT